MFIRRVVHGTIQKETPNTKLVKVGLPVSTSSRNTRWRNDYYYLRRDNLSVSRGINRPDLRGGVPGHQGEEILGKEDEK